MMITIDRLHPSVATLVEVGILFLPGIPAFFWLWPNVAGTWWETAVNVLAYLTMKQVSIMYDMQPNQTTNEFKFCPFCREILQLVENGRRLRPTCPACGFIQFKNPAPAITVLVVAEDKVLLGQRAGSPGAGQWGLPSGYIEYDEDFLTTARREVQEETDLEVQLKTIVNVESAFLSPRFHFLTVYFLAHVVGGELQAGDDFTAVAWFPSIGPLPDMAFPQDVALIEGYAQANLTGLQIDPDFVVLSGGA